MLLTGDLPFTILLVAFHFENLKSTLVFRNCSAWCKNNFEANSFEIFFVIKVGLSSPGMFKGNKLTACKLYFCLHISDEARSQFLLRWMAFFCLLESHLCLRDSFY